MFARNLKLGHFVCVTENVLGKSRTFYSAAKKDSPRVLITGKLHETTVDLILTFVSQSTCI